MKNYHYLLWGCILNLLGCGSPSSVEREAIDETISFHIMPQQYTTEAVESVTYLPLEDCAESIFSDIHKAVIANDLIYIGDLLRHRIVVFDREGRFRFAVDRKGRGPQEYLEMKSFAVDDHSIYVLDNYNHALMIYNCQNGGYEGKYDLTFVAWDVTCLRQGGFLFAFSPLKGGSLATQQSLHRLFITDNECRIIDRQDPYQEGEYDPIGKQTYFSTTPNEIVYHHSGSDVFTVFPQNAGDRIRKIKVDFGKYATPPAIRSEIDKINEGGYRYLYGTPILCGHYIALEVSNQEYFECYLYNRTQQRILANNEQSSRGTLAFPLCSDKDCFVGYLNSFDTYQSLVSDGFTPATPAVEAHLQQGGCVLLFYHLHTNL